MFALAAWLACGCAVVWAATKGPDAGGYRATDEAMYSFVDISGASGGSAVLQGTDDGTAVLTLPFGVRFYGQTYALACVSTNGALYFIASAGECSGFEGDFANADLSVAKVPNDRPALLPFWTDLTFQVAGAGAVLYQAVGTAPHRRFVVQWHNAFPQGSPNAVTFQLVLPEDAPGDVLFQYRTVDLVAGNPAHSGALATIGIRNAGGLTTGQQLPWSYDAPVVHDQTAVRFSAADTTPPVVTAVATPAVLWPPNGKTVMVTVRGNVTDAGAVQARYAVTDEYGLVQPSGPVTIATDGSYTFTVPLVSERHGSDKDGRLYAIVVIATDAAGNQTSARTTVVVPHDQR